MIFFKVSIFLFLALSTRADKKIELQDIEEDNLKSEKEKDVDNTETRSQDSSGGLATLDFFKSGLLRYFEPAPTAQSRYVHQYDVTEQPERPPLLAAPTPNYPTQSTQQAMVGYLSNVPMQIYLVPHYYNKAQEPISNTRTEVIYPTSTPPRISDYHLQHEAVQSQANYIQLPKYMTPTAKTYVQQYSPPVPFVKYSSQPKVVSPSPTSSPVLTYQVPLVQYQSAAFPSSPHKEYYQNIQYTESNTVDEGHEHVDESSSTNSEVTYEKAPVQYTRFYPPKTVLRDGYRYSSTAELPHPNPIILKSPPPHLSHIPKVLPMYRPLPNSVYAPSTSIAGGFSSRPSDAYGPPFKRRPTSLLDSYIPSHVQIEYMKRGYAKDPVAVYEALSSGRHLAHSHAPSRQYERGFLPNQIYHTAAGGTTYGHFKRAPKLDKLGQN